MSDLVERLRRKLLDEDNLWVIDKDKQEAAARIEQLEAALRKVASFMKAMGLRREQMVNLSELQVRIEQLEAALRLTRPYVEMHTLSPNGTMATVLAKIDAALDQSSPHSPLA